MTRKMALTTFVHLLGYHRGSWRLPDSGAERIPTLDYVLDIARKAEAAKLDSLFWADSVHANTVMRGDLHVNGFYEPMTVLSAIAAHTSRIGLIGTLSTTLSHPYHVARQLAALDHLSGGRAGWNIVTSFDGFKNFGIDEAPPGEEKYHRAAEFVKVVRALWDSWSDDAVVVDRESGVWVDPAKMRRIGFEGEYYRVEGPLTMPRSPQGHPVLVQAGSSGPGRAFGSSVADAMYTAQPDLALARQFYEECKQLVAQGGRDPEAMKILPGIIPVVADTKAEAEEIADELSQFLDLEAGRAQIGADLGIDLSAVDLADPIPEELFPPAETLRSRQALWRRRSVEDRVPLRSLIVERARAQGHQFVAGTPSQIADHMQEWFEARACDGFNLNAPYMPGGFDRICDKLVPELQNRGLFREDYEGTTLRDHLGLARPDLVF